MRLRIAAAGWRVHMKDERAHGELVVWTLALCSFKYGSRHAGVDHAIDRFLRDRPGHRGYAAWHLHHAFEFERRWEALRSTFGPELDLAKGGRLALLALTGGEVLTEQIKLLPVGRSIEIIADIPKTDMQSLMEKLTTKYGGVGLVA
jgi:hypothetical protein